MLNQKQKDKILSEVERGKKAKAIHTSILKIIDLMIKGDTDFNLVYLSGRGICVGILLKEDLGKETARILLVNGYKKECLKLNKTKRI